MFVLRKLYNDLVEAISREQARHDATTFERDQLLQDNAVLGDLMLVYKRKSERLEKEAMARNKTGQFIKAG